MRAKNNKLLSSAPRGTFDFVLTAVTVALVLFGIVMVYSASSYNAAVNYGNRFFYMFKQIVGAILGFAAMFALSFTDYHILQKLRYVILGISVILLVLVFVPGVGVESYGARRWINLPFFTMQASEIAKFGFIIFTASYMAKHHKKMTTFTGILPVLGVGGLICLLIILEPNMSITICVVLLMFSMLFIGGAKIRHFILLALPVAAMVPLLIIAEPYRLKRMLAFIDPWAAPLGEGYQLIQSFYSLGSGGLFGLGLFNSRQKYLFLPFSESDFIFSIIGEELGLAGCALVMFAFVLLIARAVRIAQNSTDRFGCYLASGIACIVAIQVLVNIAVVTGSIPPTGLPLPFVSAGSSSLIVFCSGVGILQSVSRCSHKTVKRLDRKNGDRRAQSDN
ncbi:MAG: putative lipid II flippase FtsW, partial [Clostridiales bacterium]|nr:putative lipid II flippase FtsW [Clostridiales bacterium]